MARKKKITQKKCLLNILYLIYDNTHTYIASSSSTAFMLGAVHKRRHQSWGEGGLPKEKDDLIYKAYLVKKYWQGGKESQKSLKIDDVFYERTLTEYRLSDQETVFCI